MQSEKCSQVCQAVLCKKTPQQQTQNKKKQSYANILERGKSILDHSNI